MSDEARRLLHPSPRHQPPHILTVMAHRPSLLGPFLEWASALALKGVLGRRDHEILALRTAYDCRSEFEWGHHVDYGRSAGLDEADLDRIVAGAQDPGWNDRERALIQAADQLTGPVHDIDDDTFAALRRHFDDAQLVEIALVVGQYAMLSMLANSMGVVLEDRYEPLPGESRKR